jgi:peptidyl-prolyl cis-trans isomerase A (cyclophilin A)
MRNRTLVFGGLAALGLMMGACRGGSERGATPSPAPPSTTAPAPTTVASPPPPPSTTTAAGGALRDPARAQERAPDKFRVRFDTTKGPFVVEVVRAWAPQGADRFYNLVKAGFFDDITFFRVIPGFMVQFGIHGDPKVAAVWREAQIPDDPVKQTNRRGAITFATAGPNTRTTQVFINFKNNAPLDGQGFAPFGSVVEGMEVVDSIYSGYGEGAPRGAGPDQGRAQMEGNAYFRRDFPKLDSVKKAKVVGPTTAPAAN